MSSEILFVSPLTDSVGLLILGTATQSNNKNIFEKGWNIGNVNLEYYFVKITVSFLRNVR